MSIRHAYTVTWGVELFPDVPVLEYTETLMADTLDEAVETVSRRLTLNPLPGQFVMLSGTVHWEEM